MERFSTFFWKLSFPEIKFFRKFPQKFNPDFDTILLEHGSNFSYSLPKILREFSHFYTLLFHSLFKVEFDMDYFALGEHRER